MRTFQLNHDHLLAVLASLKQPRNSFTLSGTPISVETLSELAQALGSCPTLTKLSLTCLTVDGPLEHVTNQMRRDTWTHVAATVKILPQLTNIQLWGTHIDGIAMGLIAKACAKSSSVTTLGMSGTPSNVIAVAAAIPFCSPKVNNKPFEVSFCGLGRLTIANITTLADAIKLSPNAVSLILSSMGINNEGAKVIATAIIQINVQVVLDLSYNLIINEGITVFKKLIDSKSLHPKTLINGITLDKEFATYQTDCTNVICALAQVATAQVATARSDCSEAYKNLPGYLWIKILATLGFCPFLLEDFSKKRVDLNNNNSQRWKRLPAKSTESLRAQHLKTTHGQTGSSSQVDDSASEQSAGESKTATQKNSVSRRENFFPSAEQTKEKDTCTWCTIN